MSRRFGSTPVTAIATVSALLLLGAGCGDDEDRLSTEEFLEQGNAICEEGNEALDAAAEAIFGDEEPDVEAARAFFEDDVIPNVQGQIDDLRDLNPPEDLEDAVDELLDDGEAALDTLAATVEADPESIFSGEDPFADVNAQAEEIGLTACADDSDEG